MTKRSHNTKRRYSRIERIERKCDRILSEILIIRQRLARPESMDSAIDRMHTAARKLREQCEREREMVKRMFFDKLHA